MKSNEYVLLVGEIEVSVMGFHSLLQEYRLMLSKMPNRVICCDSASICPRSNIQNLFRVMLIMVVMVSLSE